METYVVIKSCFILPFFDSPYFFIFLKNSSVSVTCLYIIVRPFSDDKKKKRNIPSSAADTVVAAAQHINLKLEHPVYPHLLAMKGSETMPERLWEVTHDRIMIVAA